ncbi:ubiquitin fusion degradation protein UFD1-domain-containing protein [Phyllosticta citricarpa]
MDEQPSLEWSAQLEVAPVSHYLAGDKLLLPPSALEQLLAAAPLVTTTESSSNHALTSNFDPYNPYSIAAERQARLAETQLRERNHQLPHPLTFRLVNPDNGKVVYAGIREFSAEDGQVVLSKFLRESLGLAAEESPASSGYNSDEDVDRTEDAEHVSRNGKERQKITVHSRQLPKGTYVKLRPLEAGYDPEDWKALLEQHLRSSFTTLTHGEIIEIPTGRRNGQKKEVFRFLVDGFQPDGEGICVVDTDLEVDIEPLNEEQARETLKKIWEKKQRAPGTSAGSSPGGRLDLMAVVEGQVLDGEYVDYELPSWIRSQGLEIELSGVDPEDEVDLYVNPFGSRQRAKPRADEFVFGDTSSTYPKRIRLAPTNVELEDAESLMVSVHAYAKPDAGESSKAPRTFQVKAAPYDPEDILEPPSSVSTSEAPPNADDVQCKNCQQWHAQRDVAKSFKNGQRHSKTTGTALRIPSGGIRR